MSQSLEPACHETTRHVGGVEDGLIGNQVKGSSFPVLHVGYIQTAETEGLRPRRKTAHRNAVDRLEGDLDRLRTTLKAERIALEAKTPFSLVNIDVLAPERFGIIG